MRRWLFAAVAAAMVVCAPVRVWTEEELTEAEAEQLTLNCGEIKNSVSGFQIDSKLWLEYNAQTRRAVNGYCAALWVGVEAWVGGVAGSAHADWDYFTAIAKRQVPVPDYGTWYVRSKHYRSWLYLFTFSNGEEAYGVEVKAKTEDEAPADTNPDDSLQAANDNNDPNTSPIIIDTAHDGFRLTSTDDGVLFDIDADGQLDRVAWTEADGDDEFLAMDRNGNGRIDDGSELFGNHTPVYPEGDVTAANGFEALAFMQGPAFGRSEIDQKIDARDAIFSRLLLWRDANHNGVSEPGELRSLAGSGALALETAYKTARRRDRHGNEFRQRARALWPEGEYFMYDVWLRRQ